MTALEEELIEKGADLAALDDELIEESADLAAKLTPPNEEGADLSALDDELIEEGADLSALDDALIEEGADLAALDDDHERIEEDAQAAPQASNGEGAHGPTLPVPMEGADVPYMKGATVPLEGAC